MADFFIRAIGGVADDWDFVPKSGKHPFTVINGRDAVIEAANPRVARVTDAMNSGLYDRYFNVEGVGSGSTVVTASIGGKTTPAFTIMVGNLIEIRIANTFLKGKRSRPKVTEAGVMVAFDSANRILEPQANVRLVPARWPIPTVDVRGFREASMVLPNDGETSPRRFWRNLQPMLALRDPTVDVNVFFVEAIDGHAGFSAPGWRSVFIEDHKPIHDLGLTLAHEVCHAYGVGHISEELEKTLAKSSRLMARTANGRQMSKDEILVLRELDTY